MNHTEMKNLGSSLIGNAKQVGGSTIIPPANRSSIISDIENESAALGISSAMKDPEIVKIQEENAFLKKMTTYGGKRRDSKLQVCVTNMTIEAAPPEHKESTWEQLCGYALMLWDGLGFFGFATSKLGRLKGEPVTWLTPLTDYKMVVLTLLAISITLAIVITEVSLLGTQKSSTISLVAGQDYKFDAREHCTIFAGSWFFVDKTIEKMREW